MSFICRICRTDIFNHPIPLTNSSMRHAKTIDQMIYECTHMKLTKESQLSAFICEFCLFRLEESYAFLQLCRESQQFFTSTLQGETPLRSAEGSADITNKELEHNNGDTLAVKLELDTEALLDPSEFTRQTFSAFNISPTIKTETIGSKGEKNWLVEARKHRERQRIWTAKRRAKMSPQQREKEREMARLRQAQKRASRSEDEIRIQREKDRIRQAMKRAKLREVELVQNQRSGRSNVERE